MFRLCFCAALAWTLLGSAAPVLAAAVRLSESFPLWARLGPAFIWAGFGACAFFAARLFFGRGGFGGADQRAEFESEAFGSDSSTGRSAALGTLAGLGAAALAFACLSAFGLSVGDASALAAAEARWWASKPLNFAFAAPCAAACALALLLPRRRSAALRLLAAASASAAVLSAYFSSGGAALPVYAFWHHAAAFVGPAVERWQSGALSSEPQYGFAMAGLGALLGAVLEWKPRPLSELAALFDALWALNLFLALALYAAFKFAASPRSPSSPTGSDPEPSNLPRPRNLWPEAWLLAAAWLGFLWPRTPAPDPYFQAQPGRLWLPVLGAVLLAIAAWAASRRSRAAYPPSSTPFLPAASSAASAPPASFAAPGTSPAAPGSEGGDARAGLRLFVGFGAGAALALAALAPMNLESGLAALAAFVLACESFIRTADARSASRDVPSRRLGLLAPLSWRASRPTARLALAAGFAAAAAFASNLFWSLFFGVGQSSHLEAMPEQLGQVSAALLSGSSLDAFFGLGVASAWIAGAASAGAFGRVGFLSGPWLSYCAGAAFLLGAQHATRPLSVLWAEGPGLFFCAALAALAACSSNARQASLSPGGPGEAARVGSGSGMARRLREASRLLPLAAAACLLALRPAPSHHERSVPSLDARASSSIEAAWRSAAPAGSAPLIPSDHWAIGAWLGGYAKAPAQIRLPEDFSPARTRAFAEALASAPLVLEVRPESSDMDPTAPCFAAAVAGRVPSGAFRVPSGAERLWLKNGEAGLVYFRKNHPAVDAFLVASAPGQIEVSNDAARRRQCP